MYVCLMPFYMNNVSIRSAYIQEAYFNILKGGIKSKWIGCGLISRFKMHPYFDKNV